MLNSLLYDFAKSAAAKCPFINAEDDAKRKEYYSVCFEEIWNQFLPNLRELDERECAAKKMMWSLPSSLTGGGRERSIRFYCRNLFRRNFSTLVRRRIIKLGYTANKQSLVGGQGQSRGGRGLMWLGRSGSAQKSPYQLILPHPKFPVTDLPTYTASYRDA